MLYYLLLSPQVASIDATLEASLDFNAEHDILQRVGGIPLKVVLVVVLSEPSPRLFVPRLVIC